MEPFTIKANNKNYSVKPLVEPDQILYEVSERGKLFCVVGLNEEAEWESNTDCPQEIIREIGDAIESLSE